MSDLDETRLAKLANDDPCAWEECRDMAREILRRRAADLTPSERDSLAKWIDWLRSEYEPEPKDLREAGSSALRKLLGASGG